MVSKNGRRSGGRRRPDLWLGCLSAILDGRYGILSWWGLEPPFRPRVVNGAPQSSYNYAWSGAMGRIPEARTPIGQFPPTWQITSSTTPTRLACLILSFLTTLEQPPTRTSTSIHIGVKVSVPTRISFDVDEWPRRMDIVIPSPSVFLGPEVSIPTPPFQPAKKASSHSVATTSNPQTISEVLGGGISKPKQTKSRNGMLKSQMAGSSCR